MELVQRSAFSHARLMRESADRIEGASRSQDPKEHLVAQRILATPAAWGAWELEHSGLMRQVADFVALRNQAVALRHASLRLIHGKALFEYLRKHNVRGKARARILAHFHCSLVYEHAVVAEHTIYLRKACSYLCASHLGSELVRDPAFLDPMQQYENLFTEYFELFCSTLMPGGEGADAEPPLLPLLKHQLTQWRWVILNPKQSAWHVRRESELRRPVGDTQKLRLLKF
ncbi:MAG: hypothetical protein QOK23_1111 [Gammaproteobacteria bacterium]|jgi:hypothetical protein|nr:hypothetical protein [Gammaproteobacteria bacterium]MEA3138942.1 hypothetical protein [Gammaproteobacteria bacterium]